MNLDDELRRTFRHKPAPPDLADKVLARIAEGDIRGADTGRLKSVRRWLAVAAAVTLMAAGGARYVYRQAVADQQNAAEAERVQAEIMVALQIAGEKLALVQRKVEDSQR